LVNLDSIEKPVCVLVFARVCGDIGCTAGVFGWVGLVASSRLPEDILASIITTEGRVDDQVVVLELFRNIARASNGGDGGLAPFGRVWVCAQSVDTIGTEAREVPDLDSRSGPFL
jgi:hypothetical protein